MTLSKKQLVAEMESCKKILSDLLAGSRQKYKFTIVM